MKIIILVFCIALTSPNYADADNCESKARRILKNVAGIGLNIGIGYSIGLAIAVGPTLARTVLIPQIELASGPGIEVVGSPGSSRQMGEKLASDLAGFNREMRTLGFEKSSLTQIFFSEKRLLPSRGPGYSLFITPFNLWRRSRADDMILMQPILYDHRFATDSAVLMHEWVHALLYDQYHKSSYVFKNKSINEALADFLPLHYREDYLWRFKSLVGRDITQRPDLPLPSFGGPHNTGKAISYTLWKLRERTGKERVAFWFKPFVDNLDQYYPSFAKHKYGIINRILLKPKIIQRFKAVEYEYFMAVLKKTLQEESEMSETDQFVDEMAVELGLNVGSIDALATQLTYSATVNFKGRKQ